MILLDNQYIYISFNKDAGLISIAIKGFGAHFWIKKQYRKNYQFGYHEYWWDGPIHNYSIPPFFTFHYMYSLVDAWRWPDD